MCKWQILRQSLSQSVDLRRTLCGGQCFRWRATPRETFVGVIQHRAYELRNVENACQLENTRKRIITPSHVVYFRRLNSSSQSVNIPKKNCFIGTNFKWEDDDDVDESFLTHYLSLDVDVPELWKEWTVHNRNKSHPLVQYLTSGNYSNDNIDFYEDPESQQSKDKEKEMQKLEDQIEESRAAITKNKSRLRYAASRKRFRTCSIADDAERKYVAIRHLRQDLHETLLSFVCSQNNNVKRITQMIEQLTTLYGTYLCSIHALTGEVHYNQEESKFVKPEGMECKNFTQHLHERRDSNIRCTEIKCNKTEEVSKSDNTNAVADASRKHKKEKVNSSPCNGKDSKSEHWIHLYAFPSVDELAAVSETQLRTAGFGYRSKYVVSCVHDILTARGKDEFSLNEYHIKENDKSSSHSRYNHPAKFTSASADKTNKQISKWNTYSLPVLTTRQHGMALQEPFYQAILCPDMTVHAQRERLMALQGVGRKVADCVLLFACGHSEITPIDTHMAQVADLYLCNAAILCNVKSNVGRNKTSSSQLISKVKTNETSKKMSKAKLSEELKQESSHTIVEECKSSCNDWQEVLYSWHQKTECLRSKDGKTRNSSTKKECNCTSKSNKTNNKTNKESEEEDNSNNALILAPLNDKVHDAIQLGFKALFGDYCGLAHSVLFYNRFRK